MQYVLLAILLLLAIIFFYKLINPVVRPDTSYYKSDLTRLNENLTQLSRICLKSELRGKGLSIAELRKPIKRCYKMLYKKQLQAEKLEECEKWIVDNYFKLWQSFSKLKHGARAFAFLPHKNDFPIIYMVLDLVIKSNDGLINKDILEAAINVFASAKELRYEEIVALKPMTEYVLLEYVSILATKLLGINKMRQLAKSDMLKEKIDMTRLWSDSYINCLCENLSGDMLIKLKTFCRDNGIELNERRSYNANLLASFNSGLKCAISSLFSLDSWFNDKLLLNLSPVNNLFAFKNCADYLSVSQETKMLYLSIIGKRAAKKKKSERAEAEEIIYKSESENRDIAFNILPDKKGKGTAIIYVLSIFFLTAVFTFIFCLFLKENWYLFIIGGVPIFLALSAILVRGVINSTVKRHYLPLKDIEREDATIYHTTIVVPRLIGGAAEIGDAFKKLGTVIAANNEPIFSYCLLVDLPAKSSDGLNENDNEIIEGCKKELENIIEKDRVCCLIRKRKFVEKDNKWQGYEKKRGALLEFNAALLSNNYDDFIFKGGELQKSEYVITLDSDTLTNECLRLVQFISHPYLENTTILSMNMATNPRSATTYFARLFSGERGLGNYKYYVADPENDLFFKGNYTGKGIYKLEKFQSIFENAFPDNFILSHDYIEGAYSGCLNTDVKAIDDFPKNFNSYVKRNIRWLRGDVQLLPFLKFKVKNKNGEKVKNPISLINKWHIFFNIFISFVPFSALMLIISSMLIANPAVPIITALILQAVYFLWSVRGSFLTGKNLWFFELLRQIISIAYLPVIAISNFFAFSISTFRLMTKKNLLSWQVFSSETSKVNAAINILVATALIVLTVYFSLNPVYYVFAGIFALIYPINFFLKRKVKEKESDISEISVSLNETAKRTFEFFSKQQNKKNNYLPFDNYQEANDKGWAERTSPTNIGFAFVAQVCGLYLELIDENEFNLRIDRMLSSVEKLEKWQGILYNWIDVKTLKPLNGFVSSVDMGNFLACLVLAMQFSNELNKSRMEKIIENSRMEKLFDYDRGLLFIGYDEQNKTYTKNHYDLIGSEASLTYFICAGLSKIPKASVANLSDVCAAGKGKCFYSWTGGMFEYLMADLFFTFYKGTAISKSNNNVVKTQIDYAELNRLPFFGISESQYNDLDNNGNFLYRAFGVPKIAFSESAVADALSPYSVFLAAKYNVKEFIFAFKKMLAMDMLGEYGFYEAYSIKNEEGIVKSYMSHHQGMLLLGLTNLLKGDALKEKFRLSPFVRAAELLTINPELSKARRKTKVSEKTFSTKTEEYIYSRHLVPQNCFLTNGSVAFRVDENGLLDFHYAGANIFRSEKGKRNVVLKLLCDKSEFSLINGTSFFSPHEAVFESGKGSISAKTKFFLLPKNDALIIEVKVKNISERPKNTVVNFIGDITLNTTEVDLAHKTFSGMKIKTQLNKNTLVIAKREDGDMYAAYSVIGGDTCYETNKTNAYSRGKKEISFGNVLLPVFSSRTSIRLEVGEEKTIHIIVSAAFDRLTLEHLHKLTKSKAYFEIVSGSVFATGKQFALSEESKKLGNKLIVESGCNCSRELSAKINPIYPIVTVKIDSLTGTELFKEQLKKLIALFPFVKFNLIIVYRENTNVYLRLCEKINLVLQELELSARIPHGCTLNVINAIEEPQLAQTAEKHSVRFDEKDMEELSVNLPDNTSLIPYKNAPLFSPEMSLRLNENYGYLKDSTFFINLTSFSTPAPWSNVIADKTFGTVITESGGGYTYYDNSRENKLSSFSNDPVCDGQSEMIVLGEKNIFWSVQNRPIKTDSVFHVYHGFGFTRFENNYNGFNSSLTEFVALNENTKYFILKLKNCEDVTREINVVFSVEVALGDNRNNSICAVETKKIARGLLATNSLKNSVAAISSNLDINSYSFDKRSIMTEEGKIIKVSELTTIERGGYLIASVAQAIPPNETREIIFSLSSHTDFDFYEVESKLKTAVNYFSNLSDFRLISGFGGMSHLLKWLPYQVLTSRFFGKTGFYQTGGATGFRDQLQDCLTILYINPKLVRNHILDCAAHQFEKGDVQHWWHSPDIGVRTRFSDDRLFLPYVVSEYISFTGDFTILSERVPFLKNIELNRGEESVYASPGTTSGTASILEHCERALSVSCSFGENGLVLMGGGDWNDAMDKVGKGGKGTSVWCSMFLYYCIKKFLPFITDHDNRRFYVSALKQLKDAVNNCFDGEWFTRAYLDDGSPLGSVTSNECKIDLLTQAWAEISEITTTERRQLSLYSAANRLIDKKNKIIKLLDPPLKNTLNVGYITQYPAGVRENGGQYTHAAVWYIISLYKSGNAKLANNLMQIISPINHCLTEENAQTYRVEPYVVSADVYSGAFPGRGGWSWYTGAASWLYKAIIEWQIGVKTKGKTISFSPNLPDNVNKLKIGLKTEFGEVIATIDNTKKEGEWFVSIDGIKINASGFTISKDILGKEILIFRA